MAAISIYVTNLELASDAMTLNGYAVVPTTADNTRAYWQADAVAFTSTSVQINTAIKNAAIAAVADQLSITVGMLDMKFLFCGVVAL